MDRAKLLIRLAKQAGADAAKFQNFDAPKIVSDYGFSHMNAQVSHQASWKKSVTEVYRAASIPFEWTMTLKEECEKAGIHYFSSPYDFEAIDFLDQYVEIYKAGSGEIDWIEALERMASKGKAVLCCDGCLDDWRSAARRACHLEDQQAIGVDAMQHQLYGQPEKLRSSAYQCVEDICDDVPGCDPGIIRSYSCGRSCSCRSDAGARVIERHFTDSNDREGPDHKFAMNPENWAKMVEETRLLERALGGPDKFIAENEKDTAVVQRRCLRAAREIKAGEVFTREMIDVLRPATPGAIKPYEIPDVIGTKALHDFKLGQELRWTDLGAA